MELLITYLQQGLSAVVPFIILLGLLIFVHEMGHFLVAKYFGVRVETFSLGFGKKIYQFKRGDTTYCISLIPLGGYVKMYGDEPGATVPEEEKKHSFSHKPVGQRVLVVLAGPIMNLAFAILVFATMVAVGEQLVRPVLGDVSASSQAYQDGFRSGDRIVAVEGAAVESWEQVQDRIERSPNQPVRLEVERNGAKLEIASQPKLVRNKNVMSTRSEIGEIEGLVYSSKASVVGVLSDSTSAAFKAGFKTGDQIEAINGVAVSTWRDLMKTLPDEAAKANELTFKVLRPLDEKGTKLDSLELVVPVSTAAKAAQGAEALLKTLGLDSPELYLSHVPDRTPAKLAGLTEGDRIAQINSQPIERWDQVVEIVKSYKPQDPPLAITVLREGEKKEFTIAPVLKKQMTPQFKEEERYVLGVMPTLVLAAPDVFVKHTTNPIEALSRGVELSWKWTKLTVLGFVRLIQMEVSPKNIGGVISIAQVASKSYELGVSAFLSIMAVISINLFVVNLLPVPVLDGGHLLFYSLEAIRGRPLSLKKLEIAQQVGMILLFSLMAYALFNDFSRNLNL